MCSEPKLLAFVRISFLVYTSPDINNPSQYYLKSGQIGYLARYPVFGVSSSVSSVGQALQGYGKQWVRFAADVHRVKAALTVGLFSLSFQFLTDFGPSICYYHVWVLMILRRYF